MQIFIRSLVYCTIFSGLFLGCAKPHPAGLPQLVPCTVKIVDGSQPLAEVDVGLLREEGQSGWSLGGISDSTGTVKLRTIFASFEGNGVPAGTYRVLLNKQVDVPPELTLSETDSLKLSPAELTKWNAKREKYIKEHQILPTTFSDPDATPIKLTVSETTGSQIIDVAKYK
ncbi:MAG: hypothetical protein LBN39_09615 [Planctomycetaceae bacterium]|jgi:hypothetical protein|nr:hypothetical protein [Planctomycetaceae bacterium]